MLVIYQRSGIWKKNLGCCDLRSLESEPVLSRTPTLTSSIRVKAIFHAAPQIMAKSPPNAPTNTRNHHHTDKLSKMNNCIAFQYILATI